MILPPLVALACLAAQAATTRTETWPSGARKAEYEVARDELGEEQKHGAYRSFFESGALESAGAFARGKETGPWLLHHENGAKAAAGSYADGLRSGPWETFFPDGAPESKGSYVRGAMDGRWSFWRADGTKDLAASGIYRLEVTRTDGRHTRGYFVDNVRQGAWTSYWPDRSVQLVGRYEAGKRTGEWVFTHPDGVPSALLVTGRHADGAWVDRLELPEPPPFDSSRFPALEPAPGGWPAEHAQLDGALRSALRVRALAPELVTQLDAVGVRALPVALELVRALDPERPEDRAALGFLEDNVLRRLCSGHALSRFGHAGPPDAASARELARAWLSLWLATRTDVAFWQTDVPAPSRPGGGLRDLLQDPPLFERSERPAPAEPARPEPEAVEGAARAEYRQRFGRAREEALRLAPTGTKECIARALRWLAAHQREDGGWSNAGFAAECGKLGKEPCSGPGQATYDVGATGLVLLCFLGDGHTPSAGAHREVVARGLQWLVRQQSSEGVIGSRDEHDFLYGHALGCAALCEGVGLGAEELREPAVRAVAFLESARHPEGAWRYEVPATELGDTSVTGWAVHALVAASHAGLAVDPAALEGAAKWMERVSDPLTGRVGYTQRFEPSARTPVNAAFPREMGEAMTAVGLLVRLQLGQEPDSSPMLLAHAKLIARTPPVIDKQFGGDQYYWYYATCALHELGAPYWNAWEVELKKSVIQQQMRHGDAEGSWDPSGPWGYATGRIGATALMTLALECFYRYPRLLGDGR